jgi:hypothetical protein
MIEKFGFTVIPNQKVVYELKNVLYVQYSNCQRHFCEEKWILFDAD